MLLPTLIGAIGLLSTAVQAAPRGTEFARSENTKAGKEERSFEAPQAFRPRVAGRSPADTFSIVAVPSSLLNATNTTSTTTSSGGTDTISPVDIVTSTEEIVCPTLVVSTTTIDVTVYVTATEPCDDDGSTQPPYVRPSGGMTEPCDDETTTTPGGPVTVQSDEPCPTDDMGTTMTGTMTEPCDETTVSDPGAYETITVTSSYGGNQTVQTFTYTVPVTSMMTEPCDDDTTTTATVPGNQTIQTITRPYTTFVTTEPCDDMTTSVSETVTIPGNQTILTITRGSTIYTSTEPCDEETSMPTASMSGNQTIQTYPYPTPTITIDPATSTEPCDDMTTTALETTTIPGNQTIQTETIQTTVSTSTEPCDETSSPIITAPTTLTTGSAPYGNSSVPLTSMTEPCDEEPSRTFTVTPFLTSTASATETDDTCLIDTTMTPVITVAFTATIQYSEPTETMCSDTVEDGAPSTEAAYCGVKGESVDAYFIAEFVEERAGVPVSLEGCFQFCDSGMPGTEGCLAYSYYTDGSGVPHCDLYGMPVAYDVSDLESTDVLVWYDLSCGAPSAKAWLHSSQHASADIDISVGVSL